MKKTYSIGVNKFNGFLPKRLGYRNTNLATGFVAYYWLWFSFEIHTRYY